FRKPKKSTITTLGVQLFSLYKKTIQTQNPESCSQFSHTSLPIVVVVQNLKVAVFWLFLEYRSLLARLHILPPNLLIALSLSLSPYLLSLFLSVSLSLPVSLSGPSSETS